MVEDEMKGIIAAGSAYTAEAGAAMLEQGGNAVDAAVAATFASFLAEPGRVHIGGSGMAQVYDAARGESVVYDFFSTMPGLGRAGVRRRLDFVKVTIDFGNAVQDFYIGRGSVAVPGNLFGLCRMAADRARLPLADLLAPAIELARQGVLLEPAQGESCHLLRKVYIHTPEMAAIFAPRGRMLRTGDRLFVPDLAATLEELARDGETLARRGRLAKAFVADQAARGGLVSEEDLAAYQVRQLAPIRVPYRGTEILLPPPSSTGGVLAALALLLLEPFEPGRFAPGSPDHLRLLHAVMATVDRVRPDWEGLLGRLEESAAVAAFLAESRVDTYRAAVRSRLDRPAWPTPPAAPDGVPGSTTHVSVVDADGMAAAVTNSSGLAAGYVVPGTGFTPNSILGEEDLNPGGFHTRPPGTRIATMMAPLLEVKDGTVRLAMGSGGSARIRTALLQVVSNVLDFGMPLAEAVKVGRVHLEGDVLQCEPGLDAGALAELERLGYRVNRWDKLDGYFGGVHAVMRDGDRLTGGGDPRRGGVVRVV